MPRRSAAARCSRCIRTRLAGDLSAGVPRGPRAQTARAAEPGEAPRRSLRAAHRSEEDRVRSRRRVRLPSCDGSRSPARPAADRGGRRREYAAAQAATRAHSPCGRCARARSTASTEPDAPPAPRTPAVGTRGSTSPTRPVQRIHQLSLMYFGDRARRRRARQPPGHGARAQTGRDRARAQHRFWCPPGSLMPPHRSFMPVLILVTGWLLALGTVAVRQATGFGCS